MSLLAAPLAVEVGPTARLLGVAARPQAIPG